MGALRAPGVSKGGFAPFWLRDFIYLNGGGRLSPTEVKIKRVKIRP
jgi:hypothetical protein